LRVNGFGTGFSAHDHLVHRTPVEGSRLADRYEVGAVLGHGGMGEVRAGYDTRLDREVAIKFLRADLATDPDVRSAFEREARAAAQLAHPNVVAIYDTDEQDDQPFIVMECLPGHTLAEEIQRGPIEPRRLRYLASQVLAALQSAHDAGIVHRDVKPGNVLLTSTGDAKVSDFGIAKSLKDDTTNTGPLFATLGYLAPEQLRGEKASPASDQYSLAVVLYEAATGHRPVSPETPAAILAALDAPRALTEVVDPQLRAVIERAMARDPADRFPSVDDMAAALDLAIPPPNDPEATTPITATETAVLPEPPAPMAPSRRSRPFSAPTMSPTLARSCLVGAAIAVLVVAGIVIGSGDEDGNLPIVTRSTEVEPTVPSTPDGADLPPALADALDELDETIAQ